MQYRFAKRYDFAAEMRALIQPKSGTAQKSYGTELGFWPLPDLRLGVGYNFASATEPLGSIVGGSRRGFYFNVSTKLSNLFNLFGNADKSLQATSNAPGASEPKAEPK
jgi:hypothetical protein